MRRTPFAARHNLTVPIGSPCGVVVKFHASAAILGSFASFVFTRCSLKPFENNGLRHKSTGFDRRCFQLSHRSSVFADIVPAVETSQDIMQFCSIPQTRSDQDRNSRPFPAETASLVSFEMSKNSGASLQLYYETNRGPSATPQANGALGVSRGQDRAVRVRGERQDADPARIAEQRAALASGG